MGEEARPQEVAEDQGVVPGQTTSFKRQSGLVIKIGFTGSLGSGCTHLASGIKGILARNAHYFKLSDFIKESLSEKGNTDPTVSDLQDEGNGLREEHGRDHLVNLFARKIGELDDENVLDNDSVILIDGIRNTGEVQALESDANFYLMSVHASRETRRNRLVRGGTNAGENPRFETDEEFGLADGRDKEEESQYGQKVQLCSDRADILVDHEHTFAAGSPQETEYFTHFIATHLEAMRALREGRTIVGRSPTMDETLMTMAYCASMRSSCTQRKVGAVVAHVRHYPELAKRDELRPEDDTRYHVISSGYNEVPLGVSPCALGEHKRCYRDVLKQRMAADFLCCPKCGTTVPEGVAGDYDRLRGYTCENESCSVKMKTLLPGGGGDSTGRLLDMCRALHAEENAILGMPRLAKGPDEKAVLYTTTFPCNLCANKIVEAGIDLVIYAEPYEMKEAEDILAAGQVDIRKFEGVKSTAYFRMYSCTLDGAK